MPDQLYGPMTIGIECEVPARNTHHFKAHYFFLPFFIEVFGIHRFLSLVYYLSGCRCCDLRLEIMYCGTLLWW
jgi:hypothetical protein